MVGRGTVIEQFLINIKKKKVAVAGCKVSHLFVLLVSVAFIHWKNKNLGDPCFALDKPGSVWPGKAVPIGAWWHGRLLWKNLQSQALQGRVADDRGGQRVRTQVRWWHWGHLSKRWRSSLLRTQAGNSYPWMGHWVLSIHHYGISISTLLCEPKNNTTEKFKICLVSNYRALGAEFISLEKPNIK